MKKQKEKGYPTACTPLASESERLAPALLIELNTDVSSPFSIIIIVNS